MTEKFLNKQLHKLEKDLNEGFADFEEPSDINLATTSATYNEMGFRKEYKKAVKKQSNNKKGVSTRKK